MNRADFIKNTIGALVAVAVGSKLDLRSEDILYTNEWSYSHVHGAIYCKELRNPALV